MQAVRPRDQTHGRSSTHGQGESDGRQLTSNTMFNSGQFSVSQRAQGAHIPDHSDMPVLQLPLQLVFVDFLAFERPFVGGIFCIVVVAQADFLFVSRLVQLVCHGVLELSRLRR